MANFEVYNIILNRYRLHIYIYMEISKVYIHQIAKIQGLEKLILRQDSIPSGIEMNKQTRQSRLSVLKNCTYSLNMTCQFLKNISPDKLSKPVVPFPDNGHRDEDHIQAGREDIPRYQIPQHQHYLQQTLISHLNQEIVTSEQIVFRLNLHRLLKLAPSFCLKLHLLSAAGDAIIVFIGGLNFFFK